MADAALEICRLASLLQAPEAIEPVAFREFLRLFFEHAVPHLVAAGQLYADVPEIFAEQRGVHTLLDATNEDLLRKGVNGAITH
jgi:hypothetical protein